MRMRGYAAAGIVAACMLASPRLRSSLALLAAMLFSALSLCATVKASADSFAVERALLTQARGATPQSPWVRDGEVSPQARQLLAVLRRIGDYGLSSEEFAPLLLTIETSTDPLDVARLDDAMSLAALRLIRDLHDGRVDPQEAGYELSHRRAPVDRITTLNNLASSPDVAATLAALEPRSSQYRALKTWLARYRTIPDVFVPPLVPEGTAVRSGDDYTGAAALRRRLEELGDAAPPASGIASADVRYDEDLVIAVARFQRRHGLDPDGVLGPRTRDALSVPISWRIRQIELTLERWRWLPDIQAPAVIVNVPQYMLYTLPDPADADPQAQVRKIPVIVGKEERQTPVFDSAIEAVVFRPYWEVPRSIVVGELLPLIRRDPGYLARNDMEIVRGGGDAVRVLPEGQAAIGALGSGSARLRQRPGPRNALGLIKFVLPNRHEVYLHSTPEARLFGRERRALSHGCIRVSDPTALAAYLLKDTPGDWSVDAIEAATCADATFTVRLARPVPVYILYGTVVIDGDEALFFDDIYGYDRRLEALLSRGGAPDRVRSARSN
jgi:murein L,D-transpeptidase YcbB/YkuD